MIEYLFKLIRFSMWTMIIISSFILLFATLLLGAYFFRYSKFVSDDSCQREEGVVYTNEMGHRVINFQYADKEFKVISENSFENRIFSDSEKVEYFFKRSDPARNFMNLKEDRNKNWFIFSRMMPMVIFFGILLPLFLIKVVFRDPPLVRGTV